MYTEQLAVLLFIAATQIAGQGAGSRPTAEVPRGGVERVGLNVKPDPRVTRARIKREREAMLLAEFR